MRPVFCGNIEHETRQSDLDRLFSKYGRVERIDMKSGKELPLRETELPSRLNNICAKTLNGKGNIPACSSTPTTDKCYAFVYFDDEHDAEDAIRGLVNKPFGYSRRRLSVEWSRGQRGSHHREGSSEMANRRPTRTLFVINFDPIYTRIQDIEGHFEPYGKILHVRIRRNFAFVQFESQEEATYALKNTNMSKILDRVVSVEYALKDDGECGDRPDRPRRGYGGSPYGRSRSPPYRRSRPSPDYGQAQSPLYDRYSGPSYHRDPSPVYDRYSGPSYHRGPSPVYDRYSGPSYHRDHSPDYGRYPSHSPIRRSRT